MSIKPIPDEKIFCACGCEELQGRCDKRGSPEDLQYIIIQINKA